MEASTNVILVKILERNTIREIAKSVSESLQTNPKNVLNLVSRKSAESQISFRINPNQSEWIRDRNISD